MAGRRWRRRDPGGGPCKLGLGQLRELEMVLEPGPAAWGWDEDQCWTLARIAEVVRRRFQVEYTLAGLDLLLHRIG
jgi:transposase